MYLKNVLVKDCDDAQTDEATRTAELDLLDGDSPAVRQPEAPVDLRRVRNGDPAAWDEILRRYSKLVSATVWSFRLQDADALDAIQMTWLRLAENADQIHSPERLAGWLTTTARRECLRILCQARRASGLTRTVADTIADPSAEPERRVIEVDAARRLWGFVNELSPRQRTVLRALFTDQPRPYATVAHTTGIPLGAIGPTRARALAQLRGWLEQPQSLPRVPANSTLGPRKRMAESFPKGPGRDRSRTRAVAAHTVG